MREPVFQIEEINDPVEVARCKAQDERGKRSSDWLQAHWADLLPQARGKFVAVAGQEAFIADTHEEAWAMARKAPPKMTGAEPVRLPWKGAAHLCLSLESGGFVTMA